MQSLYKLTSRNLRYLYFFLKLMPDRQQQYLIRPAAYVVRVYSFGEQLFF